MKTIMKRYHVKASHYRVWEQGHVQNNIQYLQRGPFAGRVMVKSTWLESLVHGPSVHDSRVEQNVKAGVIVFHYW